MGMRPYGLPEATIGFRYGGFLGVEGDEKPGRGADAGFVVGGRAASRCQTKTQNMCFIWIVYGYKQGAKWMLLWQIHFYAEEELAEYLRGNHAKEN